MTILNVHRHDEYNVGDWWSAPYRYFPLGAKVVDIMEFEPETSGIDTIVVGGGGLGNAYFAEKLKTLSLLANKVNLIAWGVGEDNFVNRKKTIPVSSDYVLFSSWFDAFHEVGSRVYGSPVPWVPCASCMYESFDVYRDRKPENSVGIYRHRHYGVNVNLSGSDKLPVLDNSGNNIEDKLSYISKFEYVITNTYHGVYWATLLNRKVVCVPNKSGLFSVKHKPVYTERVTEDDLHRASSYDDSLEECRCKNNQFFNYLLEKRYI